MQLNLKDELYVAKGDELKSAWYIGADNGNKNILETQWFWGREVHINIKDDLCDCMVYR